MKEKYSYATFGKQVGYVVTANLVIVAFSIISIPVLTKNLGTSLYGIWALISVAVSLISSFAMLSFSMAVIRFLAAEKDTAKIKEDYYSALSFVFLMGTIFSLLLFLSSGIIATHVFKNPSAASFIKLASILVLLNSIFPVVLAFFRRGTQIGIYNILYLGLSVLQTTLMILFTMLGYQLSGVIVAAIAANVILNCAGLVIILKQIGFGRPRFLNIKRYLKWGVPLAPNSAIMWVISASDRYIIGYLLGVSAAGIYSAAYGIGAYASFALYPIGIVLYPIISRTYDEGNLTECRNYLQNSLKYLMAVSIPAAAGLSILAVPILRILTTSEFADGSAVVPLIAFGAVLSCFYQIGIYVVHLVGKTHLTVRLLTTAAVLNIILNFLLVPLLGIIGSGLASLLSYGVLGILTFITTHKYLNYNLDFIFILKSLGSAGIMALAIWLIRPESLIMVLLSIALGVLIYFGILILVKGFSKSELKFFVSFFRHNLRIFKKPKY
jgi:O-antigen/teichoic acid export membrane protein